jgi:hypothetical protein
MENDAAMIQYEYIELSNEPYDKIKLFCNGVELNLYLEVESDNQCYRLFSEYDDKCLKHYTSHSEMESKILNDIIKNI